MGKEDTRLKKLLCDKRRFADLYNGGLFEGREIFRPEELTLLNGESRLTLKDKDGRISNVNRYRDIVMCSDHALLLVKLAAEIQGKIHYAMPVRGMQYDALDYTGQVQEIKKGHQKRKDLKDSAEFLSGFSKEDRLIPVIPLVFYYGDDEWDAKLDIHGLLDIKRMVDIADTGCFKTDLHELFTMLKYRKDKQAFEKYVMGNRSYFENLDTNTYEAARVLLGSDKELAPLKEGKEMVNMCEALQGIYQDGVNKGISQGMQKGSAQAKAEVVREMRREGISEEVIMRVTGLAGEEVEQII